ncbi:MAG: type II toxin-antitoxin system PemK/MazF family toxin [Firmicutes bacterium]|nr:type II toxin-antitoxin system PemK/MazF family toxin [Bacillota bacterium]
MKRGEIYLVDLCGVGSEQTGPRPAIIIQNDHGNEFSPTTIICPLTAQRKTKLPTHITLTPDDCGIKKDSIVLCEQIRCIDKSRVRKKLGEVHNMQKIEAINQCLLTSMGFYSDA